MSRRAWSKLRDGYGPATTAPKLLRELTAGGPRERARARAELRDRFGGDEPVSGLPAIVEELVALARAPRARERHELLLLLVDLTVGDPDLALHTVARGRRTAVERAALAAFTELEPALAAALADADARVRACAAFAAAHLPRLAAPTRAALQAAARDAVDEVRESALFALATHGRRGTARARRDLAGLVAEAAALPGCLATYLAAGPSLDEAALAVVAGGLTRSPRPRAAQPWAGGDLADFCSGVLRAHGERARCVLPAIVAAVERSSDRARMRDAGLVLDVLFGPATAKARPRAPAELDATQRAALAALLRARADADFRGHGLPEEPGELARLLAAGPREEAPATAAAAPIEVMIEVAGKGPRPVWQWFTALFDEEVGEDVVLAALRTRFTPAELLEILREATRGAFGAPLPSLALVAAALAHTGDDDAPYRQLADDTLALDADALAPPAALLAVLPLARRGLVEDRHDRLIARALRGDDDAVVAALARLLPAETVARLGPTYLRR